MASLGLVVACMALFLLAGSAIALREGSRGGAAAGLGLLALLGLVTAVSVRQARRP